MVFLHLIAYSNLGISLVSSSIFISSGLSLFSVAFPNHTAFLTSLLVISILQMFLHSPTIFWISFSPLVWVCLTLGVQKQYNIIFLFLHYPCPSVTFGLLPPLLCLCQLELTMVCLLCPHPPSFLILFSIFSILVFSLLISIVSALFCRSTSCICLQYIFLQYLLSWLVPYKLCKTMQYHLLPYLLESCKMHQLYTHIWCSTISGIYCSISFLDLYL